MTAIVIVPQGEKMSTPWWPRPAPKPSPKLWAVGMGKTWVGPAGAGAGAVGVVGEVGGGVVVPPPGETVPPEDCAWAWPAKAMAAVRASGAATFSMALGVRVLFAFRTFTLSAACGVSWRARAERAALRTSSSDSPLGDFDALPLVPPLPFGVPRGIRPGGHNNKETRRCKRLLTKL